MGKQPNSAFSFTGPASVEAMDCFDILLYQKAVKDKYWGSHQEIVKVVKWITSSLVVLNWAEVSWNLPNPREDGKCSLFIQKEKRMHFGEQISYQAKFSPQ